MIINHHGKWTLYHIDWDQDYEEIKDWLYANNKAIYDWHLFSEWVGGAEYGRWMWTVRIKDPELNLAFRLRWM